MRTFLFLLVVLACAAAGYEYFQHTQEAANYVDQRAHYGPSIADLKAKNKALLAEHDALVKKLTDLQTQAAQLKAQIGAAQEAPANTPAPAPAPTPFVPPPPL